MRARVNAWQTVPLTHPRAAPNPAAAEATHAFVLHVSSGCLGCAEGMRRRTPAGKVQDMFCMGGIDALRTESQEQSFDRHSVHSEVSRVISVGKGGRVQAFFRGA